VAIAGDAGFDVEPILVAADRGTSSTATTPNSTGSGSRSLQ
jgi:hypothetical protein